MVAQQADRAQPVAFRNKEIEREIQARQPAGGGRGTSTGAVAQRDLGRWYWLLDQELRRVQLSEAEAEAICDAVRGLPLAPQAIGVIWATVDEPLGAGLLPAEQRGALVAKLRAMSLSERFGVVDAAERANVAIAAGMSPAAAVARAGLVRA